MSGKKRPFRIWSFDRKVKKTLVVTTLSDLLKKSKEKLGYKETDIKIVLEHDGTLVEDEDYFSFLDDHTTLIVLRSDEKWEPIQRFTGQDETDLTLEGVGTRTEELVRLLRQDLAKVITMSNTDLQVLVDVEAGELCQLLGTSLSDAESIQTGCQRVLDDRNQANEAKQLLELLAKKLTRSVQEPTAGNTDIKRQRLA